MRVRRPLLAILVLLLLAGGTVAAALLPRLPAIRSLRHFQSDVPADPNRDGPAPAGYRRLTDPDTYGVRRAWVRSSEGGPQPCLVFVHGVSALGVEDGRILRAVEAFHRGGFCVIAPEIGFMTDPTLRDRDEARLVKLLQAVADGKVPEADPNRLGVVGISVGSGLALRASARWLRGGNHELGAILCIGACDDFRRATETWYALPNPDPKGGTSLAWQRNNAAAFARSYGARAALRRRFGETKDAGTLAAWLADERVPKTKPEGLETEAARAFADMILAGPAVWTQAREGLLADAWDQLVAFSPRDWSAELAGLRGVPIFLLHGEDDPLISIDQLEPLRARLAPHTLVSVLRSRMLGHTGLADVGLGEKLDHVTFMDSFFDIVKR